MIPEKYKSVECVAQTEQQDLHSTFIFIDGTAATSAANVFPTNGVQTVFQKTKLDHHLGHFLAYSIVMGYQCKFCPLE